MLTQQQTQSGKKQLTILIIEDNADQWFITESILTKSFTHLQPIWLERPDETISYLESISEKSQDLPALILLDLYLPDSGSGFRLLQILKTHQLYGKIPTFVLSQSRALNDILQTYRLGSNGYMVKPATYEAWIEMFLGLSHYWLNTDNQSM